MDELRVLVNGELLGVVAERTNGDLVLTYEPPRIQALVVLDLVRCYARP
jgi:hypothetical protein